jgi:phosphatidylglycerophosphate synthase
MIAQEWTRRPVKTRDVAWASRLAQSLARAGVQPNHISLASVGAAAGAGACLLAGWYVFAALLIQLRLLCNLLDGMVAIEGGLRTASGEVYNDLPDRVSDALILVAAGYSLAWPGFARELGWAASLLAVMTAYARMLGGACGLPQEFAGPMAKPHRMAVMTAACVLAQFDPRVLAVALMVVIAGSLITLVKRVRRVVRNLEGRGR